MTDVSTVVGDFTLKAYRGDWKTLLAFNLAPAATQGLAGFTIQCKPGDQAPYYIFNSLQFEHPADHAVDASEPPNSSINAPIHKFRWVHVPGSAHQGLLPFQGDYTYTVTPRYFDAHGSLQPLDPTKSASVVIEVSNFVKGNLQLGFTRGFTQSQAFVNHFGKSAKIRPDGHELLFDTSVQSGTNAKGDTFTYAQQYEWLGFTARTIIIDLLTTVSSTDGLSVDIFAYDLNEPDIVKLLQDLAAKKRVRLILDNASLHHDKANDKPEDEVESLFDAIEGGADLIKRGHFRRYAHDKVFIVRGADGKPTKVLTGSTNYSVTGLYVNSNHVLVFDDTEVAGWYGEVFQTVWDGEVKEPAFLDADWSKNAYASTDAKTPKTTINFSPHTEDYATALLGGLVDRIDTEGDKAGPEGSVLFAVMQINDEKNPVYEALNAIHSKQTIFSYGISDAPDGIHLYPVGQKDGVLVTGKPVGTQLPPPFSQVPNIGGVGHQIHHKFVVCGFNAADAVVYCGSSNLALGGEQDNGDNLLAIADKDVATVFAIEALGLVDHFDFLDRYSKSRQEGQGPATPGAAKEQAAVSAGWFLSTSDAWKDKYYDAADLHSVDRALFA